MLGLRAYHGTFLREAEPCDEVGDAVVDGQAGIAVRERAGSVGRASLVIWVCPPVTEGKDSQLDNDASDDNCHPAGKQAIVAAQGHRSLVQIEGSLS